MESIEKPAAVKAAQLLLYLYALIWFLLGLWHLKPLLDDSAAISISNWISSGLMMTNFLLLLLIAWGVGKRRRLFYYLALVVLGTNALLSVTDEFGFLDLLVLLIALAIILLLVVTRTSFLPAR